jgi:hypothetical protein
MGPIHPRGRGVLRASVGIDGVMVQRALNRSAERERSREIR